MTGENGNDPSHTKIRQRFGTVTNPAVAHGIGASSGPVTGSPAQHRTFFDSKDGGLVSEQGSSGSVSSQVGLEIRLGQHIQFDFASSSFLWNLLLILYSLHRTFCDKSVHATGAVSLQ